MRRKRDTIKLQDKRKSRRKIMSLMDRWPLKRSIRSSKSKKSELKWKNRPKLRNKLGLELQCRATENQDTHSSVLVTWLNNSWAATRNLL